MLKKLTSQLAILSLSLLVVLPVAAEEVIEEPVVEEVMEEVIEEVIEEEVVEEEVIKEEVPEEEVVEEEVPKEEIVEEEPVEEGSVEEPIEEEVIEVEIIEEQEVIETEEEVIEEEVIEEEPEPTLESLLAEFSTNVEADKPSNLYPSFVIPFDKEISSAQELENRLKLTVSRGEEEFKPRFQVETGNEGYQVTLLSMINLEPGSYHLTAVLVSTRGENRRLQAQLRELTEDQPDIVLLEADFQWGTVAINTDRDVYQVGDTAYLSLSFTDAFGDYVCRQAFEVVITDAVGSVTTTQVTETEFSNPCLDGALPMAQYAFALPIEMVGQYQVVVQVPEEVQPRVVASLLAQEKSLFRISRQAPTRAVMGEAYEGSVTVVPQISVVGTLSEYLPAGMQAVNVTPAGLQIETLGDGRTRLYKKGSFAAGEEFTIGYQFKVVAELPSLVTFGPIDFEGQVADLPEPPPAEEPVVEEVIEEAEAPVEEVIEKEAPEEEIVEEEVTEEEPPAEEPVEEEVIEESPEEEPVVEEVTPEEESTP